MTQETIFYDLTTGHDLVDDLDDYEGQWVNLAFLKEGATVRGCETYDTEEDAYDEWLYTESLGERNPDLKLLGHGGVKFFYRDISHVIQMPIGEV